MLTDTPGGTISAIKKPLSASIRSPDLKCSSTPDFCKIALSDVDPGNFTTLRYLKRDALIFCLEPSKVLPW